jgi:hypothetical protein
MVNSERELRRLGRFVGLTEVVGVLGVLGAVLMLVEREPLAAGVFLLAAAVAFGLGANALLRK